MSEIESLNTNLRTLTKTQAMRGVVFPDNTGVVITALGPVKYKDYCRIVKRRNVNPYFNGFPFLESWHIGVILHGSINHYFKKLTVNLPKEGINKLLHSYLSQNYFDIYYEESTGILITECVTYQHPFTRKVKNVDYEAFQVEKNSTYLELYSAIVDHAHEWSMERYTQVLRDQSLLLQQYQYSMLKDRLRLTKRKRRNIKKLRSQRRKVKLIKSLETECYNKVYAAVHNKEPLGIYSTYKLKVERFQEKFATLTPDMAVDYIMALLTYGYLTMSSDGTPMNFSSEMVLKYASYQSEMYYSCT